MMNEPRSILAALTAAPKGDYDAWVAFTTDTVRAAPLSALWFALGQVSRPARGDDVAIEPVTVGGWYVVAPGAWRRYSWHRGQATPGDTVTSSPGVYDLVSSELARRGQQ